MFTRHDIKLGAYFYQVDGLFIQLDTYELVEINLDDNRFILQDVADSNCSYSPDIDRFVKYQTLVWYSDQKEALTHLRACLFKIQETDLKVSNKTFMRQLIEIDNALQK